MANLIQKIARLFSSVSEREDIENLPFKKEDLDKLPNDIWEEIYKCLAEKPVKKDSDFKRRVHNVLVLKKDFDEIQDFIKNEIKQSIKDDGELNFSEELIKLINFVYKRNKTKGKSLVDRIFNNLNLKIKNKIRKINVHFDPSFKIKSKLLYFPILKGFENLKEINVSDNRLDYLDVSKLKNLEILNCERNYKLKTLHVEGLEELEVLNIFLNDLRTLNIQNSKKLTKIDVDMNPNLKKVFLSKGQDRSIIEQIKENRHAKIYYSIPDNHTNLSNIFRSLGS